MIRFFVQKYTYFYDKITLYFENRGICSAQNYCGPNGPWWCRLSLQDKYEHGIGLTGLAHNDQVQGTKY